MTNLPMKCADFGKSVPNLFYGPGPLCPQIVTLEGDDLSTLNYKSVCSCMD